MDRVEATQTITNKTHIDVCVSKRKTLDGTLNRFYAKSLCVRVCVHGYGNANSPPLCKRKTGGKATWKHNCVQLFARVERFLSR